MALALWSVLFIFCLPKKCCTHQFSLLQFLALLAQWAEQLGEFLLLKFRPKLVAVPSLSLALAAAPLGALVIGVTSSWQIVWVVTVVESFVAILWNTITVSLRQSIIPTHLLGRVNSVYRFFAWGSIPIGMFVGGGLVSALTHVLSRENALRAPYLIGMVLGLLLWALAAPVLTTAKIEAARRAG